MLEKVEKPGAHRRMKFWGIVLCCLTLVITGAIWFFSRDDRAQEKSLDSWISAARANDPVKAAELAPPGERPGNEAAVEDFWKKNWGWLESYGERPSLNYSVKGTAEEAGETVVSVELRVGGDLDYGKVDKTCRLIKDKESGKWYVKGMY